MSGEYLFDPNAPQEQAPKEQAPREEREERESIVRIERALAPFRMRDVKPLEWPEEAEPAAPRAAPTRAWWTRSWVRLAAAGVLIAGGAAFFLLQREGAPARPGAVTIGPAMALSEVEGAVRVDGDRVVCDEGGRARLRVGDIGWLTLEEKTRVRMIAGHEGEAASEEEGAYRLDLERGTVSARIFAAPRVFWLGTPSGIAVDLGCIYRTTVDDEGHTTLAVVSGRVSFESDGRKVYVPAGASCRAWPGFGPGTPAWDDAPEEFKKAAVAHDEARMSGDATSARRAVEELLVTERERDSLTLWHLLTVPEPDLRADVCDRLKELCAPPAEAPRERVLALDPTALTAWREQLELSVW